VLDNGEPHSQGVCPETAREMIELIDSIKLIPNILKGSSQWPW